MNVLYVALAGVGVMFFGLSYSGVLTPPTNIEFVNASSCTQYKVETSYLGMFKWRNQFACVD